MSAIEDVFKALGDPVRIKIVKMLAANGEMCVCNIMEQLGMTQPAVSHHLCTLKNAGLVRPRRQGQWIHYSLCRGTLSEVAQAFIEDLLRQSESGPVRSGCCE